MKILNLNVKQHNFNKRAGASNDKERYEPNKTFAAFELFVRIQSIVRFYTNTITTTTIFRALVVVFMYLQYCNHCQKIDIYRSNYQY